MKVEVKDWDTALAIELRPYQKECLDLLDKGFSEGKKKLLISVPTGGGKTLIFNTYSIVKSLRTLVVAHREELLEQAIDKYVMLGGKSEDTGIVKAGEWKENRYTVASIQTLYRNLDRINGKNYDLVVFDEAHHLHAPTYRAVYDRIVETNPQALVLGATATPFRSDKKDLSELFDDLAYAIDVLELIRLGYLVPVRGRLIKLPVELDSLKTVKGESGEEDFSEKEIAELFNRDYLNEEIVRKWIEYGEGRKTIFYLSSLEHAKSLCEAFERAGVPAGYVDGKMSTNERRQVLRDFKEGRIKVLTNMNVLTEGFDDPEVECIGIVRPTKSLVLYAQIVGRGLRIAPGKKDCLILDYTGISKKHTIVGLSELFGLPLVKEWMEKGEEVSIGAVEENGERTIKVLAGEGTEEFVFEGKEASRYATRIGKDVVVSCGKNGKSLLLKREGRLYDLYLLTTRKERKLLRKGLTEDYAWTTLTTVWKSEMDDFMVEFRDRALEQRATERQMFYIRRAIASGVIREEDLPEPLTKLHATNVLSYVFSTSQTWLGADVVVRVENGKLVDAVSGLELRLIHLYLLEHHLKKKISYPYRGMEWAVRYKNPNFLKVLEGLIDDLGVQTEEFALLVQKSPRASLPIPLSWLSRLPDYKASRLNRFLRLSKAQVVKDERENLLRVFRLPFNWAGNVLQMWFS